MIKLGNNNIGKIYLGSNSIGKAYLGSNLVYQSGSPQPTTDIPYIRGGAGGSYIDTGITPDNTTKVIVWARNWNPNSGYLFGSRVAYNNNMFALYANTDDQSGSIAVGYASSLNPCGIDCFRYLSGYHKYELNNNSFYIDDVLITSATSATLTNNYSIHLFGLNNGGTHARSNYPIDICEAEIWKGGSCVRRFTPVGSPTVGLYDSVTDTVFTNQGSDSFTFGSFNIDSYVPLEYIEANGSQRFDAGIHGRNNLPFIVKYIPNATSNYPQVFGCRTSSSSKKYGLSLGKEAVKGAVITMQYNASNTSYDNGTSMNGNTIIVVKGSSATGKIYKEGSTYPLTSVYTLSPTEGTFETDYNIHVGSLNNGGTDVNLYTGKLCFLSFGGERNFVPAKVNNVAGMYETYNDVFYPSATSTPFVAGNEL